MRSMDDLDPSHIKRAGDLDAQEVVISLQTHVSYAAGYKNTLQRLAADFSNFRKRSQKETYDASQIATTSLLTGLISCLDNLERALSLAQPDDAFAQGVQITHRQLMDSLKEHGLNVIKVTPGDMFDPHLHEAVSVQDSQNMQEGLIVQVAQKGYAVGDKVIRHAKVVVSQ